MIDRTTFDLRMAEHLTTTAHINDSDWRQGEVGHRSIRRALAAALITLAALLAPDSTVGRPAQRPATV